MPKGPQIAMSSQELDRVAVLSRVVSKALKQEQAAKQLGLSSRQIRRLVHKFRQEGPSGLADKRRLCSGRQGFDKSLKEQALSLIKARYADFGPTLASEKLTEHHDMGICKETVRLWMIEEGLWQTKRRKKARVHQSRDRRSRRGELIQIDGSPHDWFEGRADKCCLLVFIDDATGELMELRFVVSETTAGYFEAVRSYLAKHGRPVAWYSDKYGVFRVNQGSLLDEDRGETQFQRAMRSLDIELICANSPQAKGRVERANQTLQDRLVKELRLAGVNSIEEANAFAPGFIEEFNRRFAVQATCEEDAHREVHHSEEALELIFCHQDCRKLSKNLEVSYNNVIYQIKPKGEGYTLRGASVTLCEKEGEVVKILYKGRALSFEQRVRAKKQTMTASRKAVNALVDGRTRGHRPAATHPWRKAAINQERYEFAPQKP